MNKNIRCLLFALVFSQKLFAQGTDLNTSIKSEVLRTGSTFLNQIPEGREKEYGFTNRSDFARIRIEEPIQTYYLAPNNNRLMFAEGNEWRIPVSVNGEYAGLFTVQINNGKPEVVDFGGRILAQKIQAYGKLYGAGATPYTIIRNTVLKHDYVTNDLSGICGARDRVGLIEINTQSAQAIYQLNEADPIKVSMNDFYAETMDMLAKQSR